MQTPSLLKPWGFLREFMKLLPIGLPEAIEDKRILGEFYDAFFHSSWFVRAEFWPTETKRIINAYVKYLPDAEEKQKGLTWLLKYKVGIDWRLRPIGNLPEWPKRKDATPRRLVFLGSP